MKRARPRFYFSFRSPYSWMAARLMEARFPDPWRAIDYVPFWEPDATTAALLAERGGKFLYAPMSRQKHLYILLDVKRLTTKFGLPMAWPIDVEPWWDLPHLAYLAAGRLGRGPEFLQATYRARWERAEDICSVAVVRRLADEVGLDADVLAGAPANADARSAGADALLAAYKDDVFGVPFFIQGRQHYWGIDRWPDFAASIEPAMVELRAA